MFLVTGGAGFIGSNLVANLLDRGEDVVVCDQFGRGDKWRNLAKHHVQAVVPQNELWRWLEEHGQKLRVIFHLGAVSSTTESDVDVIWKNNVQLSSDLWKWCVQNDCRLIYASSAATYGDGKRGFKDDDSVAALDRLRPLNPYGWAKKVVDATFVRQTHKPSQWVGLKIFNCYGPNEYHKGSQQSVAVQLFNQVQQTGRVRLFKSYEERYPNGGQMRDFVWIQDVVRMFLWFSDHPEISGIFNCGSGEARTFLDLAGYVFKELHRTPAVDFIDMPQNIRKQYQYYTEAETRKLKDVGFTRDLTSLEEGIQNYIHGFLLKDDPYR